MKITFTALAWEEYLFWQQSDAAMLTRINELIKNASRTPFIGIGKPELLVGNLKGYWSRRITREHRLVYRVSGSGDAQALEIVMCRFHYRG
jgi:toxin YoeB